MLVGKIVQLADRVLWLCRALSLVKHSDRYDGAVLFMDLWTITALLKSISCWTLSHSSFFSKASESTEPYFVRVIIRAALFNSGFSEDWLSAELLQLPHTVLQYQSLNSTRL